MARPPLSLHQLEAKYGPHPKRQPYGGWQDTDPPEKLVATHCCFCGQQCGIQLKVRGNRVVGFEPREDFPFNRGKLCPKGVKRYMQNEHPDRLHHPLKRTDSGFVPISWDEALDTTVAAIKRIQQEFGKDSFAVLSGVSMTNEKCYLAGKFARVALQTANIDYNGRLCMVSAGAGNKKAFGIDRAANSWADIPLADVILVTGANVAECAPITTDYIWRARDRGARLIMIDPRVTPLARTCDLHIPVRPGGDAALLNGILHVVIERGWVDEEFIAAHTTGFDEVRQAVKAYTPTMAGAMCGVPPELIVRAAEMWGPARTSFLLHARGIEHHIQGVDNVVACINLVLASGRIGRPGCGYGTITGQGNGQGGREHGGKCDQLPGNRDISNPEHRKYVAEVWGIAESELPGKGLTAQEIIEAMHAGEIKGLFSICFNPLVSLPDAQFTREALNRLEHYSVVEFFLSETAQHADIVLPGSLQEEDEGTTTSAEGRVIRIRKAVDPPGEARVDWHIMLDIAQRMGRGEYFQYETVEEIFDELRLASKGGTADYYGITYDRIERNQGVFWPCPSLDHPGTPRLFEDLQFSTPDRKAHFNVVEARPPAEPPDEEYPVVLTTGRVVSQYLSGTQTRRIGALVDQYPAPLVEMHPQLAETIGVQSGDRVTVESRRGRVTLEASVVTTIREDTIFIPYHWPGEQSANVLTIRALDPVSHIPEFKSCACRVRKAGREAQVGGSRAVDAG
ncbi:MAG: molybdopterin oxidoreductase family protein [Armatimonadetes bacterium]|nr:molybdopterin oxidoreductase family protein [Armatimonadota bacterium]MDE2205772.1 molybdopterin oxidoreductase family protein [Armatimonadota bacterium]